MSNPAEPPGREHRWPVIELRQYTLHPGRRDELITLFDREFIESQEAVGMTVLGQLRDLDDADRFVWLRGFASMASRALALASFYDGPVWQMHREAANATMIDSDNVLLLRPAQANEAMAIETWQRPDSHTHTPRAGGLLAVVCPLATAPDAHGVETFVQALAPVLAHDGGALVGCYATAGSANTFRRLPVREGEQVLVGLARFDELDACSRVAAELKARPHWLDSLGSDAATRLIAPPQVLRLAPTARSRF